MKNALSILLLSIVLCCACSKPSNTPIAQPPSTNSASPTRTPSDPLASVPEKTGKYQDYAYTFKSDGAKTVALFLPRFLPRDDTIVTGAIRDVVKRAYNDDANGSPRLVDQGGSKAIRMDSKTSAYLTVLVKEDTGEVHSFVVTKTAL
jgi:hypothetical protein